MFYKTYKKTKKTGKYSGIYLDVPQKVILSFFNWALPNFFSEAKPIHFFYSSFNFFIKEFMRLLRLVIHNLIYSLWYSWGRFALLAWTKKVNKKIRRGEQGFILSFPPPPRWRSELFFLEKLRPFGWSSSKGSQLPERLLGDKHEYFDS